MDLSTMKTKCLELLGKYRYALLILAVGIILMLIPGRDSDQQEAPQETGTVPIGMSAEDQLADILCSVRGAGKVKVLLSYETGERTIYQTDTNDSSDTQRSDTVTVTDANRNQTGLITQVDPPVYAGAVIVCEGAEDPSVRLAILDAVSKYTGLGANQISILEMK